MEINGRNIPSLQTAKESVASGIQESTQIRGLEAIQSAFETFSASNLGILGAPELLPTVAEFAQFPEQAQYFQNAVGSNFDSRAFTNIINDKKFNPATELSNLGEHSLFQNVNNTDFPVDPTDDHWKTVSKWLFAQFKKTPIQEGAVSVNSGLKEKANQIFSGRDIQGPPEPQMIYPERGIFDPKGKELKQESNLNSGVKDNLSSNFVPVKSASGNSTKAEQSGIIIVGGKVPDRAEMNHLNLPPEPIVPHPEPAQLTSRNTPSASPIAYGPDLKGSAEQTETIKNAFDPKDPKTREIEKKMEELERAIPKPAGSINDATQNAMNKAKQPFTKIEPEYLPGQLNEGIPNPGGHSLGVELNKSLSSLDNGIMGSAIKGSADQTETETIKNAFQPADIIQGSADQTETIKKASEQATSDQKASLGGGSIVGLVSKLHWDDLKASELKGSANQTETIKKASQPNLIQGSADQTETIKKASLKGGVSKDLVDQFTPIPSLKDPRLNATLNDTVQQSESLETAMKRAKQPFTRIEPEYLPGQSNEGIPPGGASPGTELNKKLSEIEIPSLTGSAQQNESLASAMEKAKASYTPKKPEYLQSGYAESKPEGGSASYADQRGIIIVGGKSDGTYLETIDDTLAKMNRNPQPETVQLFEQQVGALQDMSTTVHQSIQMNQQLTSATLTGRFRL